MKVKKWIWFDKKLIEVRIPIAPKFVSDVTMTRPATHTVDYHRYKPTGRQNPVDGYEYEYCGSTKVD